MIKLISTNTPAAGETSSAIEGNTIIIQGVFGGGAGSATVYARVTPDAPWTAVATYTEDFIIAFLPAPHWRVDVTAISGGTFRAWIRACGD